jgi:transaldolase
MYQRILVPVDGSPTSNAGLTEAIKLAGLTGATLRVMHVVDEAAFLMGVDGYVSGDIFAILKQTGQGVLDEARMKVDAAGVPVDTALFDNLSRRLCDHVAEQVKEWGADVIVIGTHGRRGVRRMLLGSDAEQILRTATVPVLLVRGMDPEADQAASTSEPNVKPTRQLHELSQSLWLDNITRTLLDDGTLARYIAELSITGLTSNPSIFDAAIGGGDTYDAAIHAKTLAGLAGEALFTELALEDLRRAADLFRPVFDATDQVDGWVSMEISPLLAADAAGSIAAARQIHEQAQRANLFVKIPGTPQGVPAIEQAIFLGIPINVTLLFSCAHYQAAAEAYLRGIERRLAAGLDLRVGSVASLFISRWDVAANPQLPTHLQHKLGIAVAQQTYRAYRELLASTRWQKLAAAGAKPQRLLWASTGTKDPAAPDTLYVSALAAPETVDTIPENTLHAFADHGQLHGVMPIDGGDAEAVLQQITRAGVDVQALATKLQQDGADAFVKSWQQLLQRIAEKSDASKSSRNALAART